MPGPSPKPFALRVVHGTDTAKTREHLAQEPPAITKVPKPPDWLPNAHAVKEWNRLGAILVANGILNDTSITAFGHLCALHGKLVQIWAFGETPTGFLINQYRSLLSDFGITPGANARLRSRGIVGGTRDDGAGGTNPFAKNGRGARK